MRPRLSRTRWWILLAAVAALSAGAGAAAGDGDLALALAVGGVLVVLPLRFPFETVLLLFATAWLPQQALGFERTISTFAGDFNVSSGRLAGGTLGLLIAAALLRDRLRELELPRWLRAALVAYGAAVAWTALTVLWAPDRGEGVREVAKLAFPLLTAAILVADPRRLGAERLTRVVCWTFGLSLAAALVYGAVALLDRDTLLPQEETGWVGEAFGWASSLTHALFAGTFALLLLALIEHRQAPTRAWPAVALALVQIPLTLKRIAVGGAGVAASLMIGVGGARRKLWPLGIATAAALLLFFPPLQERNVSESGGVELEGRQNIWRDALESMEPLDFVVGKGIDAYATESVQLGRPRGSTQLHSEPLRWLYETGAIGLLIALVVAALVLVGLLRMAASAKPYTLPRALPEAAAGAWVFYLLSGLTDSTLQNYLVGSWITALIALALVASTRRAPERGLPFAPPVPPPAGVRVSQAGPAGSL